MAKVCEFVPAVLSSGIVSVMPQRDQAAWNLNLQTVHALVKAPQAHRVCTSCIKSGKVQKAA